MIISTVLFLVPGTIALFRIILPLLRHLLWMLFLLCAVTLGRAFGLVFFAFTIGPVFIIEKLFSSLQTTKNGTENYEKYTWQENMITEGELAGWVRVRICNTDSISELELDEELDESNHSGADSEYKSEDAKARFQMMKAVDARERGVQRWLETLKREKDEDLRGLSR